MDANTRLKKDEITATPVWVTLHNVSIVAYYEVGLSLITTKEGMEQVLENRPWLIRLVPITLKTWMPNTRLKKDEITVAPVWVKLHNVSVEVTSNEEDNGNPINDLVDETREKVEVPPKKTGIWSGRKADSPKRNIVFSPETKFYYFDRDDMEFDDTDQAAEGWEHENDYNDNG
ncbi:zinc knuckle CX2CX4HX4C containing protein [Tanacetum coccineum]